MSSGPLTVRTRRLSVAAMSVPVAPMEEVQERACQQQQVGQGAKDVSGVLDGKEECRDPKKRKQDERGA